MKFVESITIAIGDKSVDEIPFKWRRAILLNLFSLATFDHIHLESVNGPLAFVVCFDVDVIHHSNFFNAHMASELLTCASSA